MKLMKNGLLVIGASGLVGSAALKVGKEAYRILGTYKNNPVSGLVKLDVTNKKQVMKLVNDFKPRIILDAHGLNNVDYAEVHREEGWHINFDGSRNVAESAQSVGAKYIYISSDYVFSGKKRLYNETDRPDPVNYLGRVKAAFEEFLEIMSMDYIVCRTSGIYGKSSSTGKKSFIQFIIDNLGRKAVTEVVADQYTSPTLANNLVEIILELAENDKNGIYNVVGNDCITKFEFAMKISSEFGLDGSLLEPVTTDRISQVAKRPARVRMSTSKVKANVKIPLLGVKDGLRIVSEAIK